MVQWGWGEVVRQTGRDGHERKDETQRERERERERHIFHEGCHTLVHWFKSRLTSPLDFAGPGSLVIGVGRRVGLFLWFCCKDGVALSW